MTDLGVLALLAPNGFSVVNEDSARFTPTLDPLSLFVAGLVNRIRGQGKEVAVGIPPIGKYVPLLLAASVILADTLRRVDRSHGVLVISPALDLRSRYVDLQIKDVALDEAHPGSRMQPSGSRVLLRSNACPTVNDGVCFFLPRLSLPESIRFQPAIYLLDLRYGVWANRTSDLIQWIKRIHGSAGILAFYTVGDLETANKLNQTSFVNIPLDHGALTTSLKCLMKPFASIPGESDSWNVGGAISYLSREHEIKFVKDAQDTETLIKEIGCLLDDQEDQSNFDIRRGRWMLSTLAQMPVPLMFYEQAASLLGRSTLKRLIAQVGVRSRNESRVGPVMQSLRMLFDRLYLAIEKHNSRSHSLWELITSIKQDHLKPGKALILVRDKVTSSALQTWLSVNPCSGKELWTNIEVRGCPDFSDACSNRYRVAIINGPFPRRYRWIAGAALGETVYFVAYEYEGAIIERQLKYFYDPESCLVRAKQREHAVQSLLGKLPRETNEATFEALTLRLTIPTASSKPKDTPLKHLTFKSFKEAASSFLETAKKDKNRKPEARTNTASSWSEEVDDEVLTEEPLNETNFEPSASDTSCAEVEVVSKRSGHGIVYLDAERAVEFLSPSVAGDIARKSPEQLKTGDVLLRMDEDGRSNLFDQIVALTEAQPEMSYLAGFRSAWQGALHKLVASYRVGIALDYPRLLDALKQQGATIESEMALRFWVQDIVIGPETLESIRAVGRVSGSSILVSQAKQFDQAFRRIRAIRQSIGRRISGAIRRSFGHAAEGISEPSLVPVLDDRLCIPMDELIDSIDFAEVISVKLGLRVPPTWIGRFRKLEPIQ